MQIERELWRRRCQTDFAAWAVEALADVDQSPAAHHMVLVDRLERVAKGEIDRLMVCMPPGHAKSTYSSILYPAWVLNVMPSANIVAASHTADLAERFGRRTRNLVEKHQDVLGYTLAPDSRAAGRWETNRGGEYYAVGVGGSVTGRRADLIIIDDPVKSREAAESETDRAKVWDWYKSDLYTRLKPGGRIIVVMTRWHEQDLGGMLIEEQKTGADQWTVLKMPALSTEADDPLGRKPGEALWPEWEDEVKLARKRAALGERDFGALFQQDPRPAGTSFFDQRNVLHDGEPADLPARCLTVFAVIDSAVKTGSKNDGTGVTFFAKLDNKAYPVAILDWDIVQIEGALLETWLPTVFERLQDFAVTCKARMGSLGVFIEDKASGTILIQQAKRRGWKAQAIPSKLTAVGKDERAISVSGYVTTQQVKMCRPAFDRTVTYKGQHGNHFMMQVFRFQIGVKDQADDLLDTFTYGISLALGNWEGY